MSLTPKDIYDKEFDKSFSVWSYDQEEVDEFLNLVATYYEELLEENNRLESRVKKLEEDLEEAREKQAKLENSVKDTLDTAEKAVEDKKKQAQKEADLIIEEAEMKADKIINEAEKKAEREYQEYQDLVKAKRLFKVKFKTLLQGYLDLLEDEEVNLEIIKDKMKEE